MTAPPRPDSFVTALLALTLPAIAESAEPPSSTLIAPPAAHTLGFRRATARELAMLLPGVQLVDPGGIAVVRLAATDDPKTKEDDHAVTVVAVDSGSGTVITSFGAARLGTWAGGDGIGPLSRPTDVAIARDGHVGVTDTGHGRVVVLEHDGRTLRALRAHAGFGQPLGIAADGAGGFLVCDRARDAVIRLDAETGAKKSFGLEAAFDRPIDVATVPEGDRLARGKQRLVVVADRDGARLRTFDPAGAVRATREAPSLGIAGAAFDAVELDWNSNVFAVDTRGNRIHKLRDDLFPLDTLGARGTGPGRFLSPRGIAIHRRFGQVFVTEEDGGQYLWIATDVRRLRAEPGEPARIAYFLTEDSLVDVRVLDAAGRDVAKLLQSSRQSAGPQTGTWDGTDRSGRRLPPGDYRVEVRARATYASKSEFECRRSASVSLAAR